MLALPTVDVQLGAFANRVLGLRCWYAWLRSVMSVVAALFAGCLGCLGACRCTTDLWFVASRVYFWLIRRNYLLLLVALFIIALQPFL